MCLRAFALLIICQILLFGMTTASAQRQEVKIDLKLMDTTVIQGEEMPDIRAEIEMEGDLKTVLDEESGYTVGDLRKELEKGSGYMVVCDADTMTEGEYPMHIQLEERIKNSLKRMDQNSQYADKGCVIYGKESGRRMGCRPVQAL